MGDKRTYARINSSFSQDHQNVQNSSSLTKTAERGIDQIVQNLRTLKELAIDAANDSNNDWDRSVIQKEVDQRLEIIDDIAHGTKYNGKILLDGNYKARIDFSGNTTVDNILDSISEAYAVTANRQERKVTIRQENTLSAARMCKAKPI